MQEERGEPADPAEDCAVYDFGEAESGKGRVDRWEESKFDSGR